MTKLEYFVQQFENLLGDNAHGYSQVNRWGENGDFDCSSAIIWALRAAGFDTGEASYTGNMVDNLCSRGWMLLDPGVEKERGDILLNVAEHVAVYLGDGTLGEFSQSETGGVDGEPGDQTGSEASAHGYYNFPWDCVLRYDGAQDAQDGPGPVQSVGYSIYTDDDGWLPQVRDLSDFAGVQGHAARYIAIDLGGNGWYQVATADGWLPVVTGCDCNDLENGCAGDGNPIVAVRVYYNTPDPGATGYLAARYRVSPVGRRYYDWQEDDNTSPTMDGYAGDMISPIDRFQLSIVTLF